MIQKLKTLDEKTVVVFFGDHAPALGSEFFDIFQDKIVAKNCTPYPIWVNKEYYGK